jgi:hypothetical protein
MPSLCTSKSSLKKNTEISIFLKIELGKEAKKQREEVRFLFFLNITSYKYIE